MRPQKVSPRGSQPHRSASPDSLQQNSPLKRGGINNVAAMLSDESASHIDMSPDWTPTIAGGPRSTLSRRAVSMDPASKLGKAEWEARQKKNEHLARHQKLLKTREQDDKTIQEKCSRMVQEREKRFQEMLGGIRQDDHLRGAATEIIQKQEMDQHNRRQDIYRKWDAQVSQRIETQLEKFMTRTPRAPVDEECFREHVLPSDDPMKQLVLQQKEEDKFRRVADLVIQKPLHSSELVGPRTRDTLQEHVNREHILTTRTQCRPTLRVERWAQLEHYASPEGYFMQGIESSRGFHSARRMGVDAHLPDESDGIPAAGKTKHRFERNRMVMLRGDLAKQGESAQFKQQHGASSCAPCQDHYLYGEGKDCVESEFPIGKRCFPHLQP